VGTGALRILLLTDREWTHPDAGGTGTTLEELVSRWTAVGNRVTILASAYPGAVPVERPNPQLEIHRMGTRLTVFPRAAAAFRAGIGRDADVVFEVVNGVAFFTGLWPSLHAPTILLVQHVHQKHYVIEAGWLGRIGALLLERLPLRHLYGRASICTISQASRRDLVALGIPEKAIHVVNLGVSPGSWERQGGGAGSLVWRKAERPTLLYVGRLKRYKRLELLLDVLALCPGAILEVAGDGDQRAAFEAEVHRRGLRDRVVIHGFVSEQAKAELYMRAWLNLTTSAVEGWGLTVMEAASHGTPSAALRVGGLCESIVDGETGLLADDPAQLCTIAAEILASPVLRDRLGAGAAERARTFSWDRTASEVLAVLTAAAAASQPGAVRRIARPTLRPGPARLLRGPVTPDDVAGERPGGMTAIGSLAEP
jgi:glycosyltransferase involved in cell wall biosynthesis